MSYKFFYDESEHSRKINKETVLSANYAHDFVSVIVGFDKSLEEKISYKYSEFESIYKNKFTVEELKSEIIKPKQIKNGFANLNKLTVSLFTDYFNVLIANIKVAFEFEDETKKNFEKFFIHIRYF